MSLSLEELYVKNIENAIRAIKLGAKKPEETNIGMHLNKLRNVNDGLCDDLTEAYKRAVEMYKKEQEKLAYVKNKSYLYRNK